MAFLLALRLAFPRWTLVPASFRSADRDAAASGVGVFNGIGNIVGALSPVAIGALIAHTGSFDAGLMVLVGATIAGSAAMIPLVRRY